MPAIFFIFADSRVPLPLYSVIQTTEGRKNLGNIVQPKNVDATEILHFTTLRSE